MRNPPSGPVNSRFVYTFPAGTAIGPGGSFGSTIPIACHLGDNIVVNWDPASFGPKATLQLEASIATPNLGLVTMWNWTAAPIVTAVDLTVIAQVIPQG